MKTQVSVIATVKNEKDSISKLLDSLLNQNLKPEEIVIVDGGSTDGTWEIIREYCKKFKIIKCFRKVGFNIAQGRNFAIRKAKSKLIASIDGGCYADKNWLKNLVKKWEETKADVVAGIFKPWIKTELDEIEGYIQCPDIRKLKDGWEPSSRSVLFTKEIWKIVGGYPENTQTAEDTFFNKKLKIIGAKYALSKKSIVYWKMRGSPYKIFLQFYKYGEGDAFMKTFNFKKISLIVFPILIFPLVIIESFSFLVRKKIYNHIFYLIGILLAKRLGYLWGFYKALIK